jgi:HlyD family secretion protein
MKRLVAFIVILIAGGASAYYYYVHGAPEEKPTVMQLPISQGDIEEAVRSTGTLEAVRLVNIGSQVSGIVAALHADFNSIVKEGDLLAEIDPNLLKVQVDIQKANIQRQEGDIENQRVQLIQDQRGFDRAKEMHAKGLIPDLQLEQAELTVRNRQAQINSAEKSLFTTKANLSQAELNLSYTKIYSPVTGVVVNRHVDRGQAVQASMNAPQFFTIATDIRELRLTAGVDEAEIGRVRAGMRVFFQVDTYGATEFEGIVDTVRLNATNQNNVVTYPVWIRVPNPDLRLKPSMTAQLRIVVSNARNVVRVPVQATRFRPNDAIYTALGLEPPQAGRGSGPARGAGDDENGRPAGRQGPGGAPPAGQTPATGQREAAPGAGAPPAVTPGAGGGQPGPGREGGDRSSGRGDRQVGGQSERSSGRGFGGGGGSLTPEQRKAFASRFGGAGGRGGGENRQRAGGQGAGAQINVPKVELDAKKIDELLPEVPRTITPGSVWTWNPEAKELKQIRIETGVSDGTFLELIRGDLQPGQQVVTGVILPQPRTTPGQNNNLFGGQQPGRGMPGGMTPGGGPGGGGGRGGGGR